MSKVIKGQFSKRVFNFGFTSTSIYALVRLSDHNYIKLDGSKQNICSTRTIRKSEA